MVRKFKLINEKGQQFFMNNLNDYCLLTNPQGLGVSYSTEYEQIENTYVKSKQNSEQCKPNATVNFSSYTNFRKFVDFIKKSENLKLSYKIPFDDGEKEYFRDINIQNITKSEMQQNGIISETITIECLSLWYEKETVVYTIQHQSNEMRWNFKWNSKLVSYNSRRLHYINNGHVDASVEIEIQGRVVKPKFELYVEGKLYQEVTFNTIIDENEKLLYGTKENEFHITRQKVDKTYENLFSLDIIKFENDNIIRLPKNKSCELRLLTESGEIANAQITIFVYYEIV